MDSSAFAQETDLQQVEMMVTALQLQVDALGLAPVPRTGQTSCYDAAGAVVPCGTGIGLGQDGDLQLGVTWPNPRFTDNEDGTVKDNLTDLTWLDDADCFGTLTWPNALAKANALYDGCSDCGGTNNDCGLRNHSVAGEWRLPNIREMLSLVHYGLFDPAIPDTAGTGQWTEGNPFLGVKSPYWTATYVTTTHSALGLFSVGLQAVQLNHDRETVLNRVWLVRGGQ